MELHPRTKNYSQAKIEFETNLISWMTKYDLTIVEIMKILNDTIANQIIYLLRVERHPYDSGKKADEL